MHDWKFGWASQSEAIAWGAGILPLLREESDDFRMLSSRNSTWIAAALGAIVSDTSRELSLELYSRQSPAARLTGAIALAQQGALPDAIGEDSFLARAARTAPAHPFDPDWRTLAVTALGRSRDSAALPALLDALRQPAPDSLHAGACVAVARIGSPAAGPVLADCLRTPQFRSLPEAFRVLLSQRATATV